MILKGHNETLDARLDRVPSFDPRSRAFPVSTLLAAAKDMGASIKKPRSFTWKIDRVLDQGAEGACVGFGWTHELLAKPVVAQIHDGASFARGIYRAAQRIDEWPGEAYEGTSVLAGAKTVVSLGGMLEYRWCFSLDDLIMSVGYVGPVVLGLNWYQGMVDIDRNGFISPIGSIVGGHCILANAVSVSKKHFVLTNSWGKDWGVGGTCKMSFQDMERLLHEQGEACVPIARRKVIS